MYNTPFRLIQNMTMEQLWGGSTLNKVSAKENLCCIKLSVGGYLALSDSNDNYQQMQTKEYADIFTNKEANEILRQLWVNGTIEEIDEQIG